MKLFLRRYGQGFPVIILHGLLGNSDYWIPFARKLASDFDVIVPDLRNHGHSPHSRFFTYKTLTEDILELINDLKLQHCCLIGHSMGGKTAMMLALENPGFIEKLVVVDISPKKYPENRELEDLLNAMLEVDFEKTVTRKDVKCQLEKTIHEPRLSQLILKNVYRRDKTTLDWRLDVHSIHDNLSCISDGIECKGFFNGPALFIRGELSDYIRNDDVPGITQKFPRATVQTLNNASHWVHADVPGEFYEQVRQFLQKDQ
ncbi:MAG: alpha/beta fold hydrolase [Bacteroidota bacterium]|nr:alpha/beta fold hydrolase [Bacteroidota bacterium]